MTNPKVRSRLVESGLYSDGATNMQTAYNIAITAREAADGLIMQSARLTRGDENIAMVALAVALMSLARATDTSRKAINQLLDLVVKDLQEV